MLGYGFRDKKISDRVVERDQANSLSNIDALKTTPFKNIMLATDYLDSSVQAFRLATMLTYQLSANLIIEHIVAPASVLPTIYKLTSYQDNLKSSLKQAHINSLPFRKLLLSLGVKAKFNFQVAKHANIQMELRKLVESSGCDLLVIGNNSRKNVNGKASLFTKRFVKEFLQQIMCPVLVA